MSELFPHPESALVCMRVGSIPDPEGSVQRECARCKHAVWASWASLDAMKEREIQVIWCMECIAEASPSDAQFAPPTAGQLAEMPAAVREIARETATEMTVDELKKLYGPGQPTTTELIAFCRVCIARCPCGGNTCGVCRWLWEMLKKLGAPEAR